jgi:pyruvate formate lyase activating enzyme
MGKPELADKAVSNVKKSIEICLKSKIPIEIRTTIVPTLIDDEQSIREIAKSVQGCHVYILQQYSPLGDILDPKFKNVDPPKREILTKLAKAALEEGVAEVHIRTRENGEEKVTL